MTGAVRFGKVWECDMDAARAISVGDVVDGTFELLVPLPAGSIIQSVPQCGDEVIVGYRPTDLDGWVLTGHRAVLRSTSVCRQALAWRIVRIGG